MSDMLKQLFWQFFLSKNEAAAIAPIHRARCDVDGARIEIYTPSDFAVIGRTTDTGESFVDGPSSALLQSSPAVTATAAVADSCWTNSVRRPPKSLPVASVRHCSTLGPGRSKDRRHFPLATDDTSDLRVPQGQPADWMVKRLMRLCRDDLRFLEKLGEGRFAEVRDCMKLVCVR